MPTTPTKDKRFTALCSRVEYVQSVQNRGPRLSVRDDQTFDRLIDKALHHLTFFVNLDRVEAAVVELEQLLHITAESKRADALAQIATMRGAR